MNKNLDQSPIDKAPKWTDFIKNEDVLNQMTKHVEPSEMNKFLSGFRKLCKECNMTDVSYSLYELYGVTVPIIKKFDFSDGSYIGILALLEECGFKIKYK